MEFFKIENNTVIIDLNPKLYNLETIYSASYQLIDNAFIRLDGDPEKTIMVTITFQDKNKNTIKELEILAKQFLNQLINYNFYKINSKKQEQSRKILLQKSIENASNKYVEEETIGLDSNNYPLEEEYIHKNKDHLIENDNQEEIICEEDLEFDDPDGIAIPWEEKFDTDTNSIKEKDFEFDNDIDIPWDENKENGN